MQDLKPRFHSSRFHGSEDVEDEVYVLFQFLFLEYGCSRMSVSRTLNLYKIK